MSDWNSDSDDEKRILHQTWNKFEKIHRTHGYREGALVGEDKQFQEGFDKGFRTGFEKSHDLAVKHGEKRILRFMKTGDQGADIVESLRISIKTLCDTHALKK